MKVIIDSNIFYDHSYSKTLKSEIINFIKECIALKISIIIPTTVVAEVDRKQRELNNKAKEDISKSVSVLKNYQIDVKDFDMNEIISEVSIIDKLRENNASIEVVTPSFEIYERAHKNATEHNPPCIKKEDEMRDLIIWEIACDIARKEGGALIISDDKLFWGSQGDNIANEVNLIRVRNLDDGLGALEVGTPARIKAEAVLAEIWEGLTRPPIPLDKEAKIKRLYNTSFTEGDYGLSYAFFYATLSNTNEKLMEANFQINFSRTNIDVKLLNIVYDGKKFKEGTYQFSQERTGPVENDHEYASKLASLRNLIGA